ncbi:hypothetical protein [Sphingomonas sp.]|jgi:hypothetical protein|uniref:hypothetical protein n=1 Tax=Sphingomonas sp. TaxID=28214 RepID=UPI0035C7DD02
MPDAPARRGRQLRITPGAAVTGLTTIIVALLAMRDAAVQVTARQYPQLAVKLAPANATAITRIFDTAILGPEGLSQNNQRWAGAALQALRADPLNGSGLRLLAYVDDLEQNGSDRARTLMLLSERASRRDLLAQIWLIEDAVRRGDIDGALQHYDRALSVRPASAGQLFPILVAATTEPAIRQALVPYLRANRPWVPSFLSVLVEKSPNPAAVAALFQLYSGARAVPSHAVYESTLLKRLVSTGDLATARSLASHIDPRPQIWAFGFDPATTQARLRPLTWALYDGADGAVVLDEKGALAISVGPERRIVAASRILSGLPRNARLQLSLTYPDPAVAPLITWRAYCRHVGRGPQQFWVRDLPATAGKITMEGRITIPDDCRGVQVDVEATGASGTSDSRAVIDRVSLAAS